MVWEAFEWDVTWDFIKEGGFRFRFFKFTADADGCQNKHADACEPWNALCTAKLNEVIKAGCDAFAWQTRRTVDKKKGVNFDQWLRPRQIALRPPLNGRRESNR